MVPLRGRIYKPLPGGSIINHKSQKLNYLRALYIETRRGHTPKGDIGKNTFVCYQIFSKKKPPVRDKSMSRFTLMGLSSHVWLIDATDEAMKLGNPILSNIIMIGAISALGLLPVGPDDFMTVIRDTFPEKLLDVNRRAFEIGRDEVAK
jgi:Pyruvate/2-oxoacid:ferredoxin oxidoreductase gamma subunit